MQITAIIAGLRDTYKYFALSFFAYLVLYCLLMPDMVITHMDDFGYYEGLVRTLKTGRIQTGEWLGPYNVFFTAASALTYKVSENFYASTFGVLAFFSILNFILLFALLLKRSTPAAASATSFLFCTLPVYLIKSVEYTSIIPAITLFLSAILFFERGKYLLFFVAAFLSVITRQHSIVLLILPLYAVASRSLGRKMVMRFIVYFVFLSACCYLVISNLNVTYAQHHVINKTYKSIEAIPYLKTLLTGAFIYISLLSLFNVLCNGDILKLLKHNIKIFPLPLILTVSLLIHLHFSRHLIINEFGYTYNFLPALILISLWLMDWKLLKPSPLNALAIGYIFLSSFRYIWWDYYFIEVIIISLLVTVRRPETARFKYLAASVLALILSVNLYCSYHLKVSIDAVELNNIVYEHLERDGVIDVSDMSGATLGFIGWKLFDYYIENEGKNFRGLTAFLGYVKANKIILEHHTPLSRKFKPFGPKTRIMFNGKYNIGFLDLDFRVLDTNFKYYQFSRTGSPLMGINKRRYSNKPFPLSNKEWKHIIESERHM